MTAFSMMIMMSKSKCSSIFQKRSKWRNSTFFYQMRHKVFLSKYKFLEQCKAFQATNYKSNIMYIIRQYKAFQNNRKWIQSMKYRNDQYHMLHQTSITIYINHIFSIRHHVSKPHLVQYRDIHVIGLQETSYPSIAFTSLKRSNSYPTYIGNNKKKERVMTDTYLNY